MDALSCSSSLHDSTKLEEIIINQATTMTTTAAAAAAMDRCEVRKSKSRVRSYLKKCKDALYGHPSEETCTITVHENPHSTTAASSGTSWYLTEIDTTASLDGIKMCNIEIQQLPKGTNQADEQEAIDNEIKCISMTQTVPLVVESKV